MRAKSIIILLIVSLSCFAQKEHMSFYEINMDCSIKEFASKLKTKGFTTCSNIKFNDYKSKTLKGNWWWFPDCKICIRQHVGSPNVSSIYVHPTTGYTRIYELIDAYDEKYGNHVEYIDNLNGRDFCLTWTLKNGVIQLYGSNIFGQSFNIVYRDVIELSILKDVEEYMDSAL